MVVGYTWSHFLAFRLFLYMSKHCTLLHWGRLCLIRNDYVLLNHSQLDSLELDYKSPHESNHILLNCCMIEQSTCLSFTFILSRSYNILMFLTRKWMPHELLKILNTWYLIMTLLRLYQCALMTFFFWWIIKQRVMRMQESDSKLVYALA